MRWLTAGIADWLGALLGFLGGLLSFAAGAQAYSRAGTFRRILYRIAMWRLKCKFDHAMAEDDKQLLEAVGFQLAVTKLNSPDPVDQIVGMGQLEHLGSDMVVEILAARLGRTPPLSDENKTWLLARLRLLMNTAPGRR